MEVGAQRFNYLIQLRHDAIRDCDRDVNAIGLIADTLAPVIASNLFLLNCSSVMPPRGVLGCAPTMRRYGYRIVAPRQRLAGDSARSKEKPRQGP